MNNLNEYERTETRTKRRITEKKPQVQMQTPPSTEEVRVEKEEPKAAEVAPRKK